MKLCGDLLPRELASKLDSLGGSMFVGCDSVREIAIKVLEELDLDEAVGFCEVLRAELLAVASEQAQPVASMGK